MRGRRTVARIAALVLIMGGFTVMQGNSEQAQAAPLSTRSWTYWLENGNVRHPPVTTTLTYSTTDTAYDAVARACRAAGQPAPARGTDLEKLVSKRAATWFVKASEGGYATEAFMELVGAPDFAEAACAGGKIREM